MSSSDKPPRWAELLGRVVGLTPRQVEWRWRRWHERKAERTPASPKQAAEAPAETSTEQTWVAVNCQHCHAVQRSSDVRCTICHKRMVSYLGRAVRDAGHALPARVTATMLLAAVCVGVYAVMVIQYPITSLFGWTSRQLLDHGALWHPDGFAEQWWRLGTACLLHIGVMHLIMNTVALFQTGSMVEEVFGRGRTVFIFMLTGILANVASVALNPHALSAGASGAIMGLIGVTAGVGQRMGRGRGFEIRNHMLRWALMTMVFGYFIGADNVAHGAGFVLGGLIGIASPPRAVLRSRKSGSAAIAGAVGLLVLLGCAALASTKHRMPASAVIVFDEGSARQHATQTFRRAVDAACIQLATAPDAALATFAAALPASAPPTAADLRGTCAFVTSVLARCTAFQAQGVSALTETEQRNDDALDYFETWCATPK